jgi:antitoxin component YwqK of YwqJK toxin-antitoxin module
VIESFKRPINGAFYYPSENGGKQVIQTYSLKDGLKIGTWKSYHRNLKKKVVTDRLSTLRHYNQLGQRMGEWKEFYSSGEPKSVVNYTNGKANGEFFYYYENGQTRIKGEYTNGVKSGQWRYYNRYGGLEKIE